ncbi:retrotransposon protein, putative, ty1-copia subclass [Tanacetum coccineum]
MSSLDKEFFVKFQDVLNQLEHRSRFNFTSEFPNYKEVLYKPDFKEKNLRKIVIFDMDMSAGDFLALFYILKVPVKEINLKEVYIVGGHIDYESNKDKVLGLLVAFEYQQVVSRPLVREVSGYLGSIKKVFLGDSFVLEEADLVSVWATKFNDNKKEQQLGSIVKEEEERRLWRIKMRALLIQHGCEATLEVLPTDMEGEAKAMLNKKSHSVVILCLGNKVLIEVTRETTAVGVWLKLETLYMTNSLANKFYMKKKLYTFYMPAGRKISEHIHEFNKIVLDLANIEVKFEDGDLPLLLLTSLPASYKHFVDTLLYGQKDLTLEDVMATLNSKKIKERRKSRLKSQGGRLKCYICQSEDHLKRNCPKNNRKKSTGYVKKDDLQALVVRLMMIMSVLLGDNKECKIRGIGKVMVQLRDGSSFVLHNSGKVKVINGSSVVLSRIRRDNCVYSLDGHVVADELNASVEEKDSLAQVWHKRLGHISEARLQVLEKLGLFGKQSLGGYRSSSTAIEKKTPMEMWLGHPGDYEMLRVFGCVAYSHVKQGKLEPRAVKCILLGYLKCMKGYRLYLLYDESPKIVTSRNMVFNEGVMYKDTLKDSDQEDGDDDAGDPKTNQTHDLTDYQLVRDRDPRTKTKPLRFRDESNMVSYTFVATEEEDTHEPLTYQESVACEDSSKWKVAINEEMDSLRKNKTWELVDHPAGQKLESCKWLFKIKEGIKGVQKPRHTSIQVIYALTACKDYELDQLDVKTAFLHKNLEEVIYMRQPLAYVQGNNVCLLKKSLYGLKQSPKQWYRRFDKYMLSNGFKCSSYDNCIYYMSYALENGKSVKMPLGGHFKLSLKDCPVRDCDVERMSKVLYAYVVGSLMYLMVCTRPDIVYTVSTANVGLVYGKNHGNHVDVIGFVDSDDANDPDKGRSITGYAFLVQGCVVGTEHNAADALTKVVPGLKLQHCLELLNVGIG